MNIHMKEKLKKLRRKIVVIKFTMSRGYNWVQTPTMGIVAAGVLKPYFPKWHLWQLALVAFSIFLVVGFLDRKLKFLNEESSYATERNTLLMKRFDELKAEEGKKNE